MPDTFTLAFHPEACDTAADTLRRFEGYGMTATLPDGRVLDVWLEGIEVDHDSGEYVAVLREYDHDRPAPNNGGATYRVNLYDDLRLEVN